MKTLFGPSGNSPAARKFVLGDSRLEGNGFGVPLVPQGSDINVDGPLEAISDGEKEINDAE